jgi:hypothetical protein
VLSDDRNYRYELWRYSDRTKPPLVFVGVNPSTADEVRNDNTVDVLEPRALKLGLGGVEVVNLYAWRSKTKAVLRVVEDPEGPDNDKHILRVATIAGAMVMLGWGALVGQVRKDGPDRARRIVHMLRAAGVNPLYLGKTTTDGQPYHPLYQPLALELVPWPLHQLPEGL